MKAYIKDQTYAMEFAQDNTELRKFIKGIQESLNKVVRDLNTIYPDIEFTNNEELQVWERLTRAITEFNDLEVAYIFQLYPEVKESLINLYGTETDISMTRLINEILQQKIDDICGKKKN